MSESKILSREAFNRYLPRAADVRNTMRAHDAALRARVAELEALIQEFKDGLDCPHAEISKAIALAGDKSHRILNLQVEADSLRRERDENFAARVKLSEVLAESVKNTEQAITELAAAIEAGKADYQTKLIALFDQYGVECENCGVKLIARAGPEFQEEARGLTASPEGSEEERICGYCAGLEIAELKRLPVMERLRSALCRCTSADIDNVLALAEALAMQAAQPEPSGGGFVMAGKTGKRARSAGLCHKCGRKIVGDFCRDRLGDSHPMMPDGSSGCSQPEPSGNSGELAEGKTE